MKDADAFVPGTSWIDFSKKSAADLYWKWFAERLVSTGVDAWWLDAVEPENDALHGRRITLGDGDRYRNIYPLLVNTEADRRMRALRPRGGFRGPVDALAISAPAASAQAARFLV